MAASGQDYGDGQSSAALDLPLTVMGLANEDQLDERKSKLDAIGTLLEKAIIRDPYQAVNS